MDLAPRLFDRRLRARRLERAFRSRAPANFLRRRAAEDAAGSLSAILRDFPTAVDLTARDGLLAAALEDAGVMARIGRLIRADAAGDGLDLVLDEELLPFAEQSVELIVSLLSLHWTDDLPGALVQIRRALKPDGVFVGALFGGSSLQELRWALAQAEEEATGGASPRVSPFADAFDGAALLQRAGFALPVTDIDRVTVRYADPMALIRDLRAMGETALFAQRPGALTRETAARAFALYAERYAGPDGKVPATFEIVTLTGWAPHPDQQKPLRRGSATTRLADALGVEEGKL